MSKNQIINKISTWVELVKKYNDLASQLSKLLGGWINSPVAETVEEIIEKYQASLSAETGIHEDSLFWFRFDNEFGEKGLKCGLDGKYYTIDSVEAFVEFELLGNDIAQGGN